MCTIHIIKCHKCGNIETAWRRTCKYTPANRLCNQGQTNRITTYLLPGHCDLCRAKMGPHDALAPVETTSTMAAHRAIHQKNEFETYSCSRGRRYANRLRMISKWLASGSKRSFSYLART
ncbi:hypothetical protein CORC01_01316 [Colletotrichum orchidophilum]|uniref:Uncharacterized protein n=1 Tax=Colletotrichum orchidophilum TaxID=1209926 RepID=A0A1G4BPN5_9PEZI|nr:uncharacterized protein CORC01_01316 [Colletotrichum orchidophilum]OHF03263.1 hypothetical protein CORC01_01316 [Colletotrichum orchidophilum]